MSGTGFPAGFGVEHDEQVYTPEGLLPYVTANGSETILVQWATQCPACGGEFRCGTGLRFRAPRRRCDHCKRPGKPVNPAPPSLVRRDAGSKLPKTRQLIKRLLAEHGPARRADLMAALIEHGARKSTAYRHLRDMQRMLEVLIGEDDMVRLPPTTRRTLGRRTRLRGCPELTG